jgi:hypothetical protein
MYQLTKKRNSIWKFLGFLLAISITAELLKVIFQRPSINELLMDKAKEINSHCPIMFDSLTRLDNSMATSDNKLQLNYTFIKTDKADIDTLVLKNDMSTSVIAKLNTDPKFKNFKQDNITIEATFYDKSGNYVCNLVIIPNDLEN